MDREGINGFYFYKSASGTQGRVFLTWENPVSPSVLKPRVKEVLVECGLDFLITE